jgi:uncharacterized membrane protein
MAANVAFVGAHFVMSHPLRNILVQAMGEKGFLGVYSLVSLATFFWIVVAFRAVDATGIPLWNGRNTVLWITASSLAIISLVLLLGSMKGNPAVPQVAVDAVAKAEPTGVLAVTRHPMMWGVAIWAVSHMLVNPDPRTLVTAGAMLVLALVGAHLQDRKKEVLLGKTWNDWKAKTCFWPRWTALAGVGWGLWLVSIVAWLAATWAHVWLAHVPAGIWRWVG